ncbi:MAG: hypothetical protein Q8S33_06015 [Myxococcales bacterium]|nr:hypothetical protein [Myxococcales bacterium]
MRFASSSVVTVLVVWACPSVAAPPVPQASGDAGAWLSPLRPGVVLLPGGAGLSSTAPQREELPPEFVAERRACPRDEHGAFCALVSDERALLEAELAQVAKGERTLGLCHAFTAYPTPQPTIDVELSSPDGSADLGLLPAPQRVRFAGVKVLKREQVFGACALLDGRPALVEVGRVRDGRQTVTIRRRPSTPLSVVVKTRARTPVSGWLHAIPPYDWPDTEAVSVPLSFSGHTAEAPERSSGGYNADLGVWSVVSVKVGRLVAAQLVRPTESRVVLTPGPPATMRIRVKALSTPVPLSRAWFEDVSPDSEMVECLWYRSWGRWGEVDLGGATTAVLEVPPGARRCVFFETTSGDVVAVRAPTSAGTITKDLQIPSDDLER